MRNTAIKVFAFSACAGLAGCGGGSETAFDNAYDGYIAMADSFVAAGYDVTPVANIPPPTASPATYDGFIVMDVGVTYARESYAGSA